MNNQLKNELQNLSKICTEDIYPENYDFVSDDYQSSDFTIPIITADSIGTEYNHRLSIIKEQQKQIEKIDRGIELFYNNFPKGIKCIDSKTNDKKYKESMEYYNAYVGNILMPMYIEALQNCNGDIEKIKELGSFETFIGER